MAASPRRAAARGSAVSDADFLPAFVAALRLPRGRYQTTSLLVLELEEVLTPPIALSAPGM